MNMPRTWDTEACILSAASRAELIERAATLTRYLASNPPVALKDVAYTLNTQLDHTRPSRLAIVASSLPELSNRLATALQRLVDPQCARIKDPNGIYYFQEPLGGRGKLAFLFPGEGAQYPNMLLDLCLQFPEVRAWFDLIDRAFVGHPRGYLPSQIIFPIDLRGDAKQLWQMDAAVEAVFTANQALYTLLSRLAIRPDVIVGHSSGEYSALLASGAWRVPNDECLIQPILDLNGVYEQLVARAEIPEAVLLAVGTSDRSLISKVIEDSVEPLYAALDNCPHQVVLCGTPSAARRAAEQLQRAGAVCEELPFSRAYHTPLFENFTQPLREFFGRLDIGAPSIELYSCAIAAPYPTESDAIRELAVAQWARPVRFRETIEAMYSVGVRVFVEVGPRGNLTAFVDDTLRGKPSLAVASNLSNRTGMTQLNHLVALLAAHHVPLNLEFLYARRAPQQISFEVEVDGNRISQPRDGMTLSLRLPSLQLNPNGSTPHVNPITNHAQTAAASVPPQPVANGQSSVRAQVMDEYLKTMDRFLTTQQAVMQAFLSGAAQQVVGNHSVVALLPTQLAALSTDFSDNGHAASLPEERPAQLNLESMTLELLKLISERTGYPVEMLGAHVKLESDLGIDSIKRVEILGEFQHRTGGVDQADLEALSRMTTIQQIVDLIAERLNGAARPTVVTVVEVNTLPQLPFIRQIVSHAPGRELVAVCDIDLEEDLFLKEHTLAGRISMTDENLIGLPVMPLTVSMEILAEAAFTLQPQRVVVGMRDVRAYRWLAVDDDRLRLHITAQMVTPDEVEVQLREADANDPSRPKPGLAVIEAVVIFGDTYPRGETIESFDLSEARASKWRTGAMYDRTGMFHGPLFQWVTSMDRTGADGAIATFNVQPNHTFFRSDPQPAFLIDPVLLDAMGQVVGYWTGDQFQRGLSVFPFKLERLETYGPALTAREEVKCHLRVNFVDDEWIRSDIDVIRSDGTLLARMIHWEDRRLDLPRRVYDFRIAPHEVLLSDEWPATLPVAHQIRVCRISRLPEDLFEAHGAIWLRVLAYMILNRRERQTWRELNAASSKRRRDWLMGRIVAKDAVRLVLKEQWGLVLCPADIEITSAATGRPEVNGNWLHLVEQPPIVSIAHSGDVAVALVSANKAGRGLGIDLEPVDRVSVDIEQVAFTLHEQQLLSSVDRSEWATRLWCAKEAVGKAIGRGLINGPRELEIQEVDCDSGAVVVKLVGELARDLVELADKPIVAQTVREDEWIIAMAML